MSSRHLPLIDIGIAMRRGRPVEQFLGRSAADPECIRVVELCPQRGSVALWVHDHRDVGSETEIDWSEFPTLEPDGPEHAVATFDDAGAAVQYAEAELGAAPTRWVNAGIAESEYLDFVRAGRPGTWPPSTD